MQSYGDIGMNNENNKFRKILFIVSLMILLLLVIVQAIYDDQFLDSMYNYLIFILIFLELFVPFNKYKIMKWGKILLDVLLYSVIVFMIIYFILWFGFGLKLF